MRLKLAHLPANHSVTARHLRVAFLVAAADTDRAQQLVDLLAGGKFQDQLDKRTWAVGVQLPDLSMEVRRSSTDNAMIETELVNGKPVSPMILGVNGQDLASAIWEQLPRLGR